jgi:lipoprotein Spr/probable lipoprotein NlpC
VRALLAVILTAALLPACSGSPDRKSGPAVSGTASLLADEDAAREALYRQYSEWKGVRYRNGGMSKRGVDCSGFVVLTFRDRFGVALPRSTKEQAKRGRQIRQKSLSPGDLVFFKTGFFSRHVGIYVGQRTFLHVSVQKGVSMSSLDNSYWSRRYWQSRRMTSG